MITEESKKAFNEAIQSGRLSAALDNILFAGNFMYMGTDANGTALFKHIGTRKYLPLTGGAEFIAAEIEAMAQRYNAQIKAMEEASAKPQPAPKPYRVPKPRNWDRYDDNGPTGHGPDICYSDADPGL